MILLVSYFLNNVGTDLPSLYCFKYDLYERIGETELILKFVHTKFLNVVHFSYLKKKKLRIFYI